MISPVTLLFLLHLVDSIFCEEEVFPLCLYFWISLQLHGFFSYSVCSNPLLSLFSLVLNRTRVGQVCSFKLAHVFLTCFY